MGVWSYLFSGRHTLWPELPVTSFELGEQTGYMRPLLSGEAHSLAGMIETAFEEERQSIDAPRFNKAYLATITAAKEIRNVAVICLDDEVVGFVMIDVRGNNMRLQRELAIKYIYFKPQHRSLHLLRHVIGYLYDVGQSLGCLRFNWGFDTGMDTDRKRKLARFLGFEFQGDIFRKNLTSDNLTDDRAAFEPSGYLTSVFGFRRYFQGPSLLYWCLVPLGFVDYAKRRKTEMGLFLQGQKNGRHSFISAVRSLNAETNTVFATVEVCHIRDQKDLRALEAWARAQDCRYILFDTAATGKMDHISAELVLEWGAGVIGCTFSKPIAAHAGAKFAIRKIH